MYFIDYSPQTFLRSAEYTFKMFEFSIIPNKKLGALQEDVEGVSFGDKSTWTLVTLTTGENCPVPLLSPGTIQTNMFGWTAAFYLARTATVLTIQRSASDYTLLRTSKLLSSYETNMKILQNFELKIFNPKTEK